MKIKNTIQHQKRKLSRPSWDRLGPVLGRFGVDLGIKTHKLSVVLYWLCEQHVFEEDNDWKGILGRTWVDLVAGQGPKWNPNRIQNGRNMVAHYDQKRIGF